jgi:hypothetical protein
VPTSDGTAWGLESYWTHIPLRPRPVAKLGHLYFANLIKRGKDVVGKFEFHQSLSHRSPHSQWQIQQTFSDRGVLKTRSLPNLSRVLRTTKHATKGNIFAEDNGRPVRFHGNRQGIVNGGNRFMETVPVGILSVIFSMEMGPAVFVATDDL